MKKRSRLFQLFVMCIVFSAAAEYALAQFIFPGGFSFSFATSFLNNVFLLPFKIGGCI